MSYDTSAMRRDIRAAFAAQRDADATRQMNYYQLTESVVRLRLAGDTREAAALYFGWIKQGGWA